MRESSSTILRDMMAVDTKLSPLSKKVHLSMDEPSLADNLGDVDRLRRFLERELGSRVSIPLSQMQLIPYRIREGNWKVTVTVGMASSGWDVIDVEAGHTGDSLYGLAVDVGTTTVVVYLVDLATGRTVDTAAGYNGQVSYGEDILTRIYLAGEEGGC